MLKELAQRRIDELKQMRKGRLLEIAMNGTNSVLPLIAKITTYSVYVSLRILNPMNVQLTIWKALVAKGDLSGELSRMITKYLLIWPLPSSVSHVLFIDGTFISASLSRLPFIFCRRSSRCLRNSYFRLCTVFRKLSKVMISSCLERISFDNSKSNSESIIWSLHGILEQRRWYACRLPSWLFWPDLTSDWTPGEREGKNWSINSHCPCGM